jgi:hypothetical protein
MYGKWASLSTFSRFSTFIWKLKSRWYPDPDLNSNADPDPGESRQSMQFMRIPNTEINQVTFSPCVVFAHQCPLPLPVYPRQHQTYCNLFSGYPFVCGTVPVGIPPITTATPINTEYSVYFWPSHGGGGGEGGGAGWGRGTRVHI